MYYHQYYCPESLCLNSSLLSHGVTVKQSQRPEEGSNQCHQCLSREQVIDNPLGLPTVMQGEDTEASESVFIAL